MRRLILLGLLAAMVFPAGAAKRVTVAQLEQTLAAEIAAHRADADLARKIGELELTERLTDAALGRFSATLPLQPGTALALQLLADQSAFLDPPAGELPATATPDAAAQARMMDAARGYVIQTVPHLPDFFVTRTTNRFDNAPHALEPGSAELHLGMRLLGRTTRDVTFRDGREIQDTGTQTAGAAPGRKAQNVQPERGLRTWGEFGPALTVVLTDVAKGKVAWSHWERTPAGLAAVFRYSAPKAVSHFEVNYCCVLDRGTPTPGIMGRGRGASRTQGISLQDAATRLFSETRGYHGSLSIDPNTGAILRITLEAELKDDDPLVRAATVVQYGPVAIGDRSYTLPVRSLAFSMEQVNALGRPGVFPILLLNETSFTHYHRLGASVRVLADTETASAPNSSPHPEAGETGAQSSGAPASLPPASTSPGSGAQQPATQAPANAPAAAPAAAVQAESAPSPPEPVIPEITLTAANGVPDEPANLANPANPAQPREGNFQFSLTSRLVDVGIVAYDKKGHPVKDLKPEDFEVYDNGRRQEIRFFAPYAAGSASPPANAAPDRTFSNRAADPTAAATTPSEAGPTVLLIDESHIAWGDISHARQEILRFLGSLAPGERVGLYTMTGLGFRVLQEITADHAALAATLQKWMPTAQSVAQAQEEETRNRQSFNEVHNVADLNSVNGNQIDVPDADTPVDPQLHTFGGNPARDSLIILGSVARHLAAVPGHKNLVWVSSDNVFADWQNQAVAIDKGPKPVDAFALYAQEAMNDAHVAVFPLDVSQIETAAVGAEIRTRNIELTPAAQEIATLGGAKTPRDMTPGRITAEMQQDIHPIQGPIRQVADATGGRVIRRAGDMAAQLTGVVEDAHATYMIGFSPQGPADGKYHAIAVKLAGKYNGLTLRYRTGYLFAKEPASLKDRFQQAVWRPRDVSDVSVTAGVTPMSSGAEIKIEILTGDLGLQQQEGRWLDKLDIFFIQRDDAGLHAQVQGQTLGLRLKPSTYRNLLSADVPFQRFVQLRPGMASLRVLVVDENSGRMGSVTIPAPALEPSH